MIRSMMGITTAFALAFGTIVTRGDELGSEIDLTAFGQETIERAPEWDDLPLDEVAYRPGGGSRRFYVSGMIGPSFANLSSPVAGRGDVASSDTLFNAGGALGVAFERTHGRLRLELEGMGRSKYTGLEANGVGTTFLTNNWSAITNIWRDFMITERFGVYGGGGIGGGGYKLGETFPGFAIGAPAKGAFAWQAGGGLLWEINDRLTFDAGYRFFQIDAIQQQASYLPNQFAASEVMFSLRLYEPFRAWSGR